MSIKIDAITFDCSDPRRVAEFWAAVTGFRMQEPRTGWAGINDDLTECPRLLFVRVPEGQTVKNRIHLDLRADDVKSEVSRLVGLGASVVEERSTRDHSWTVLHDPEGNEFCIEPRY